MNKPWVGYLSSMLLAIAGILMIAGKQLLVGILFIVVAVAGLVLKYIIHRSK